MQYIIITQVRWGQRMWRRSHVQGSLPNRISYGTKSTCALCLFGFEDISPKGLFAFRMRSEMSSKHQHLVSALVQVNPISLRSLASLLLSNLVQFSTLCSATTGWMVCKMLSGGQCMKTLSLGWVLHWQKVFHYQCQFQQLGIISVSSTLATMELCYFEDGNSWTNLEHLHQIVHFSTIKGEFIKINNEMFKRSWRWWTCCLHHRFSFSCTMSHTCHTCFPVFLSPHWESLSKLMFY